MQRKICKEHGHIYGHPNKEVLLIGGEETDATQKKKR